MSKPSLAETIVGDVDVVAPTEIALLMYHWYSYVEAPATVPEVVVSCWLVCGRPERTGVTEKNGDVLGRPETDVVTAEMTRDDTEDISERTEGFPR